MKMAERILYATLMLGCASCAVASGKKEQNADGRQYDPAVLTKSTDASAPVNVHGKLALNGAALVDAAGKPVQLRGVSSHGLQWFPQYVNEPVLQWLKDDWKIDIWRAAMYTDENGYISNPGVKKHVVSSIETAVKLGLYVIIDWHILHDNNPQKHKTKAIAFFSEMAQKYGDYPNVIYEICNEPNGQNVSWEGDIKPYAEEVIAAIRKYDNNNIIVVGTPNWSQRVSDAADDPITGYSNIMYALHFYAGTHGSWLRDLLDYAQEKDVAVFVTEWGTTLASGDDGVYKDESLEWLSFLKSRGVSWLNWSLANKDEDAAILKPGVDSSGKGNWKASDLSESGAFVRGVLRGDIALPPYEE
jgi:endoglucanase